LYLETMQEVFSNVSKVVVESKQGSNLLYLPLDKLMQQTASVNAPANGVPDLPPSAGSNSGNSRAGSGEGRNRDADRSRAREFR
jgi:membrane protease subunit HflK